MRTSELEIRPKSEADILRLANSIIKDQVAWIQKNVPYVDKKFDVEFTHSFQEGRTTSYGGIKSGGQPYISMDLSKYPALARLSYVEYSRIVADRDIGSLMFVRWEKHLAAYLAHEIAHAYQLFIVFHVSKGKSMKQLEKLYNDTRKWSSKPGISVEEAFRSHGYLWQYLYRQLRKNMVNNW